MSAQCADQLEKGTDKAELERTDCCHCLKLKVTESDAARAVEGGPGRTSARSSTTARSRNGWRTSTGNWPTRQAAGPVRHPGQLGGDPALPVVPLRQLDLRRGRRAVPDPRPVLHPGRHRRCCHYRPRRLVLPQPCWASRTSSSTCRSVAALLTLVGYSVNDTIVVFDRIREVRGKNPSLTAIDNR